MLTEIFKVAMEQAGLPYEEGDVEVLFPSVTKDTTTETLKNLAVAQAQGWIAKRTAAEMAAKELNITKYDFDEEQDKIKDEEKDGLGPLPPVPPDGRFGLGPSPNGNGTSEIHGDGKRALAAQLKTL